MPAAAELLAAAEAEADPEAEAEAEAEVPAARRLSRRSRVSRLDRASSSSSSALGSQRSMNAAGLFFGAIGTCAAGGRGAGQELCPVNLRWDQTLSVGCVFLTHPRTVCM